jgi:hypothetical protein
MGSRHSTEAFPGLSNHLISPLESGASISNRNRIMTGVKFLLRVTLEPHDLTSEVHQAVAVRSIFRCHNSAISLFSTGHAKMT